MIIFQKHTNLSLLLFMVCIVSCQNPLYNPINDIVEPSLKHKDINLNLNANISDQIFHQLGISYSPINHMNISYSGVREFGQKSNALSLGYYTSELENDDIKKSYFINVGSCLGINRYYKEYYSYIGPFPSSYEYFIGDIIGKYQKHYLQIGLFKKNKKYEWTVSTNAVIVDWKELNILIKSGNALESDLRMLDYIKRQDPYYFQELNTKFGLNIKNYKVFMSANYSLSPKKYIVDFNRFNGGIGVSLRLNKLFKSE